jgi:hypothetical protein
LNSNHILSSTKGSNKCPFPIEVRDKNKESSIYTQNSWIVDIYLILLYLTKCALYNQPKPYFFQKIIMKSFLDRFLTNVTPKHSELSIFLLFIYSLCSYECFFICT